MKLLISFLILLLFLSFSNMGYAMGEPVLRSQDKIIEVFKKQQGYDNPIIG
ncbi:MAG: hypothetical protein HQ564_07260, partial [Candidatus Saganbacteria bacterium]|nr:hypothetical protein [Candidatus Saganbacteria bacterium]